MIAKVTPLLRRCFAAALPLITVVDNRQTGDYNLRDVPLPFSCCFVLAVVDTN